jgi:hypothetical protein
MSREALLGSASPRFFAAAIKVFLQNSIASSIPVLSQERGGSSDFPQEDKNKAEENKPTSKRKRFRFIFKPPFV